MLIENLIGNLENKNDKTRTLVTNLYDFLVLKLGDFSFILLYIKMSL
jgi:hypothetical protein